MSTPVDRPNPYQLGLLKESGCRVRPHSYESARRRIGGLPPSAAQAALLAELGLPVPETRTAASEALTAYEAAHPEWAKARRAARTEKGRATRQERRDKGQEALYNETLQRYHRAGVERFGDEAASLDALAFLRALALRLPRGGEERLAAFGAMGGGLSAEEAGTRIEELKQLPAR